MVLYITKSKIVYGFILMIFLTNRAWGINVPWYVSPIAATVGILYSFILRYNNMSDKRRMRTHYKLLLIPYLVIFVYTVLLWISNRSESGLSMYTALLSATLSIIVSTYLAISVYKALGSEAIVFAFKCGVVSYIAGSVIPLFFLGGLSEALLYLFTLEDIPTINANFIMEVHDLTFAFGVFFIYFFCFEKKRKVKIYNTIICFLVIFWGLKRIEIAALLVCLLIYVCFTRSSRNFKYKSKFIGISVLAVSFLYIYIVHSNILPEIAEIYDIDFKGRLGTYNYMVERYSDFSITFLGNGYRFIDKTIQNLRASELKVGDTLIISGLHSDVLKLYMELGFVGFALWAIYQLFVRTNKIFAYFGERSAALYLMLTVYMFILYLTDNVYSYTATLFAYMLVVLGGSELDQKVHTD